MVIIVDCGLMDNQPNVMQFDFSRIVQAWYRMAHSTMPISTIFHFCLYTRIFPARLSHTDEYRHLYYLIAAQVALIAALQHLLIANN